MVLVPYRSPIMIFPCLLSSSHSVVTDIPCTGLWDIIANFIVNWCDIEEQPSHQESDSVCTFKDK